jgi:glycosyltransferase involved in cell wall biosynthesis
MLDSLQQYGSGAIESVLLAGGEDDAAQVAALSPLVGGRVVRLRGLEMAFRRRRSVEALVSGVDHAASRACRDGEVDVVFDAAQFYGWRFPFPVVSWLPDFQHRHLPHMFPRSRWWRREVGYRMQARHSTRVLVSSEAAADDIRRFYPAAAARTRVARFAVLPPALDPVDVRHRLGLPERYLALPNQFWKHKNHRLVVEALALLQEDGVKPVVIATGNTRDARFPGLYDELSALVERQELGDQFRSLGHIPYADVMSIVRTSIGLLNPSLFEGWSTTVEEAKALGVPLLLSDLPVHREQGGRLVRYFQPDSALALARVMRDAWTSWPAGPRPEMEREALASATERRAEFGRAVEAVLLEAGEGAA